MALETVVGHTDDGLVFLQFEGQQTEDGRPIKTIITMEPDHAMEMSKQIRKGAKRAINAAKRPLIVGQEQTFKKA